VVLAGAPAATAAAQTQPEGAAVTQVRLETPAPAAGAESSAAPLKQDATSTASASDAGDDLRAFGYAALVFGGLCLTTSALTLAQALDRASVVDRECSGGHCSDAGEQADRERRAYVAVSAVSLALGVLSTGAGIYLVWRAPDGTQVVAARPMLGPRAAGLSLAGAF